MKTAHFAAKRALRTLLLTSAIAGVALGSSAALAQEASADEADSAEPIVVTASRTATNGLDAPTPTQIVGVEVIERQAATTVMEVLNQNPAFKATRSPGANATNTSSPGQATADLRGLGGQRTLVLVNGSRVVPFAPASNLGSPTTTDLNLFPTIMIERVDVVTGGASALYGSDAISGVVNVIMRKKYDGVMVTAQSGISQRSDYHTQRLGFIAGTDFSGGRGNLVISGDWSKNDGVGDIYNRGWGAQEGMIVSNSQRTVAGTPGFGQPAFYIANGVKNSLGAGGVILGGRTTTGTTVATIAGLTNMTINPDGSIRPFQKGSIFGGSVMVGGEGVAITKDTALVPGVERLTLYGSLYYDFTDSITGYIEGGWSKSFGRLDGTAPRLTSQVIQRDNAYIPASVRALLPANIASFNISRIGLDIGNNFYEITNRTPHGTAGIEVDLGSSWKFATHVSYGVNKYESNVVDNAVATNLAFAVDAVRDPNNPNNIVCRAVLQNNPAAAGCQPINLFGENNFSAAAKDYILGEGYSAVFYDQLTVAGNVVGELFALPGGPVKVAFGGEHRRETQELTSNPISAANGFISGGNAVPYAGKFDVTEGYLEATAPLLESLDLNGAVRYADYSTVGGQWAWKLGGVWEPVSGFNIRVGRSRDIRAPAINELYSPGVNVTNSVTLVVDGVSKSASIPQNTSKGDINVGPEFADTWTVGFAYRGEGKLRGFGLSLDYYNIKIRKAITNLSTVNIANLCGQGQAYFCNLFTYGPDTSTVDPNDRIHTALVAGAQNVGKFDQQGIDFTLSYATSVDMLGEGGRYSISAGGTYVIDAIVDTGTGDPAIDRAGENGWANLGSTPTFRGNLTNTIGSNRWELSLQSIFISAGVQDKIYNTNATNTVTDNSVPAVVYFNLFGKLFFEDKKYELFWAVNNLLDKDPPATPYSVLNSPVNGQYYDKVGRNFMIGVRAKF